MLPRTDFRRVEFELNSRVALIRGSARTATVTAMTDGVLFTLDKDIYNTLVRDVSIRKRQMYSDFLDTFGFLQSLYKYNKDTLCDVLVEETFEEGDIIVQEGEKGDRMFLIVEGEVKVFKLLPDEDSYGGLKSMNIANYGPGEYFGELAIWKKMPRACSVIAGTTVNLLSIDIGTFRKLLKDIEDDLEREVHDRYNPLYSAVSPKTMSP